MEEVEKGKSVSAFELSFKNDKKEERLEQHMRKVSVVVEYLLKAMSTKIDQNSIITNPD